MAALPTEPNRARRRARTAVALGVFVALAAATTGGCTTAHSSTKVWGPSTDPTATTSPSTRPGDDTTTSGLTGAATTSTAAVDTGTPPRLVEPQATLRGAAECRDLARGPWADVDHGTDPIGVVRAGHLPPLLTGPDGTPLDQITEMPTIDDYDDPSTLMAPSKLYDAFAAAGYQEGIEARYQNGNEETVVTVVRFRDAASAKAALSAHLDDYCTKAVEGHVTSHANGLLVLRDTGSARTLFVLDDLEVSLLICSCFGATDRKRQDGLEQWAGQVEQELRAAPPEQEQV